MTEFSVCGYNVKIYRAWRGYNKWFRNCHPTYQLKIIIDNTRPFYTTFHDSVAGGKREWQTIEYIDNFSIIISDALAYANCPNLKDFQDEYGNDDLTAFRKCKSLYDRLTERIAGGEEVLSQIYDECMSMTMEDI